MMIMLTTGGITTGALRARCAHISGTVSAGKATAPRINRTA